MDVQKALAMKQIGLAFHMEVEMKSLPQENRKALMAVFTKYWNKEIELVELQEQLREKTNWFANLESHGLHRYLNAEDLHQ